MARALVVMGVSGVGKSTVAARVAERLGRPFIDGDDLHPAENISKLTAGVALTDADREPWLAAVRGWIDTHAARGESTVLAVSALRRRYRDALRRADTEVLFAHLVVSPDTVRQRLARRTGHFMNPNLIDSQFATLEPLDADEAGADFDATRPLPALVAAISDWLRSS